MCTSISARLSFLTVTLVRWRVSALKSNAVTEIELMNGHRMSMYAMVMPLCGSGGLYSSSTRVTTPSSIIGNTNAVSMMVSVRSEMDIGGVSGSPTVNRVVYCVVGSGARSVTNPE